MNKIQRVSKFLRIIFQVAFVVWPLILILYWIFGPQYTYTPSPQGFSDNLLFSFIPRGTKILHPITGTDALFGFLIGVIPTAIGMMIIYFLIKLFKLYEQGKIFTLANVQYLKKIGIYMLINQGVGFIYDMLISFALTFHNPPAGKIFVSFNFSTYDAYAIITAIMVIVISWIMAEGCKLQEEHQYTV